MAEIKIKTAGGGQLNKLKELYTSFLFYLSILLFFIGFNFADAPMQSGWYQQFMPNLGGRQIKDITFTDSLNGYAIASRLTLTDTSFILRTTNGGDNWFFNYSDSGVTYNRIQFIDQNTGFVGGYIYKNSSFWIVKTTNKGTNWFYINAPFDIVANDMFALNQDTIWLADAGSATGGIFRTTDGGFNWDHQMNQGAANPDKIYMYNWRLGFANRNGGSFMYWTSNSGQNWTPVPGVDGFTDIYFIDSLTGWKAYGTMKKTTNGGFNWVTQTLPSGGIIINSGISSFSNVNRDTIWGGGGDVFYGSGQFRGLLYRTINGGNNWLFQVPDTSIHSGQYRIVQFINKLIGWANWPSGEVHTTTGGGDTFYTPIKEISSNVPDKFKLFQNFPNPFNPKTKISYELKVTSYVRLLVYDVRGKTVDFPVDTKQNAGRYETDFDGSNYSSGIYFYSLIVNGKLIDTKKMVLLK